VLAALSERYGAATPTEANNICATFPQGEAALTSLIASGDVFTDQQGNLRALHGAKAVVDGRPVHVGS
jgi:hypothetical protein